MFGGSVKSALFIDFDNMIGGLTAEFPRKLDHWLAWLEAGGFDPRGRKRRFVAKRAYWNYHNRRYAEYFEPRGFETFTCLKRTQTDKTNLADMMIALDALELAFQKPQIEEYVILSADTDFVALIDKLGDRAKQTVAFEKDQTSMREFERHADLVVTAEQFRAAFEYPLPQPNLLRRLFGAQPARSAPNHPTAASETPPPPQKRRRGRAVRGADGGDSRLTPKVLEAVEQLRALARQRGWRILGRKAVNTHLREKITAYETTGARPYLGLKSYENFIGLIAETQPDFELHEDQNRGLTLMFRG